MGYSEFVRRFCINFPPRFPPTDPAVATPPPGNRRRMSKLSPHFVIRRFFLCCLKAFRMEVKLRDPCLACGFHV